MRISLFAVVLLAGCVPPLPTASTRSASPTVAATPAPSRPAKISPATKSANDIRIAELFKIVLAKRDQLLKLGEEIQKLPDADPYGVPDNEIPKLDAKIQKCQDTIESCDSLQLAIQRYEQAAGPDPQMQNILELVGKTRISSRQQLALLVEVRRLFRPKSR